MPPHAGIPFHAKMLHGRNTWQNTVISLWVSLFFEFCFVQAGIQFLPPSVPTPCDARSLAWQ